MIRKLRRGDLDRTAEIWLAANLQAHDFIAPEYWKDNQEPVKKLLPQAEEAVHTGELAKEAESGEPEEAGN